MKRTFSELHAADLVKSTLSRRRLLQAAGLAAAAPAFLGRGTQAQAQAQATWSAAPRSAISRSKAQRNWRPRYRSCRK